MVQALARGGRAAGVAYPGFDVVVGTSADRRPARGPADAQRRQDDAGQRRPAGQVRRRRRVLQGRGPADPLPPGDPQRAVQRPGDRCQAGDRGRVPRMLKAVGHRRELPRHDYVGGTPGRSSSGPSPASPAIPTRSPSGRPPSTPRPSSRSCTTPSRTRSTTPSASPATRRASSTPRAGSREAATPNLKGNQCENCHGPGVEARRRARRPRLPQGPRPDRRQDQATAPASAATTTTTRPSSTSPLLGKIIHKGLDTYNDPKVHQGQPAEVAREGEGGRRPPDGRSGKESRDERARDRAAMTPVPMPSTKFDRFVARYRQDHRHPVNHVLHVGVGWPLWPGGRPAAVPAALVDRPCSSPATH